MKPYQAIPISDCGEPLVPILVGDFARVEPHPYVSLGAPYGDLSPFYLRQGVLEALHHAQAQLQRQKPGWLIQIFDAYRPIAVQQFMVDHAFQTLLGQRNRSLADLTEAEQASLWTEVYQFWALPSDDPRMPPPHSTGAALDVTLVDETGQPVPMGSPIDELSPRSLPNYFAAAEDKESRQWHCDRTLLYTVMQSAGFRRHPNEWWHFSLGDQLWAWLVRQEQPQNPVIARYGRINPSP